MGWERCGNTPYYRKYDGGWSYVNPFDWSHISIGIEKNNDFEGSASIVYRKAPRYDFDILKSGVKEVFAPEDQQGILRATHGWFADKIRAKQMQVPDREMKKIFHGAPPEERDRALEGVKGLVQGYDQQSLVEALKLKDLEKKDTSITLVAVGRDTPAARHMGEMEEFFDYSKRFFVADTLDLAIEEALAYLGIYEC